MQAGPRPVAAPKKRRSVTVTGIPQEAFAEPAKALAEKLGWKGDPSWVGNDITVRDAQRYLQKVLHEAHVAAARGNPCPDYSAACVHLAVDNADEQAAIDGAVALAYDSGKGQATSEVNQRNVSLDARAEASASAALGKMTAAGAKK